MGSTNRQLVLKAASASALAAFFWQRQALASRGAAIAVGMTDSRHASFAQL
jgi:hypothetical protein